MNDKNLYLPFLFLFLLGCSSPEVPVDQLTYKNGLKVLKESGEPLTGMAIRFEGGTTPTEIIEYKQGKLDGRIQTWYSNGELKEDFNGRLKDEFHVLAQAAGKGKQNIDRLEKKLIQQFLYRYGKEIKWYENGEMESEGQYAEDGSRKIGFWREWYKNGELKKESEYSSNLTTSLDKAIAFASNGNKSAVRALSKENGLPIGKWKKWYENGELNEEGEFNDKGQINGITKTYCKNGSLGMEAEYRDGIPAGTMTLWACDGTELDRISFQDGIQHGLMISYKKKKSVGSSSLLQHLAKAADREESEYDIDSADYYKLLEGELDTGKPSGLWTVWNEEGKITTVKDYSKDNFINADYSKPFLKKGKFGPYATTHRNKWQTYRYNFKDAKPDIEATQLYLKRNLINPAKKIITKKNTDWRGRSDGSVSHWTYPIIVTPEVLFEVIKSYPEVKVDAVDTNGQNRLHLCTILMLGNKPSRCSFEHFNDLLKHIPLNAEDNDGMAVINYVTESFHKKGSIRSRRKVDTQEIAIKAINALVKAGTDINHKNAKGQTPLMAALSHKEYDIAKVLLELGADINTKDTKGYNALNFVFFERSKNRKRKDKYIFKLDENRKEILTFLAQKSVQIDSTNLKGESIKDIALKHGAVKIVQFLETLSDLKSITNPP
jgi:antitoxin component YwqK of YwqJK toxin-antitoxin module